MSEILQTLRKKNDTSVEVYPNIKSDNIPADAITTAKILDGAVTENKINTGAVTSSKIGDGAVTLDKVEDNIKDAVNNFNSIYDSDLGEMSVDNLEVTDDANIGGNVNIDNDLKVGGTIKDGDNYEIKALFNHSISVSLKIQDTPSARSFLIHLISSYDDNITTLNELIYELGKKINLPVYDNSYDIMGVLIGVDAVNNEIEIFCGDGNGGLVNYVFDAIVSISDDIYSI